jgi:maltose alpha-D-glucosyltransferase / alpha-amylase
MLGSFAYAGQMALQQCSLIPANERQKWQPQLDRWEQQTRRAFIDQYTHFSCSEGLYASPAEIESLLRLLEMDAALTDLRRELLNRPEWAEVPLRRLSTFIA